MEEVAMPGYILRDRGERSYNLVRHRKIWGKGHNAWSANGSYGEMSQ